MTGFWQDWRLSKIDGLLTTTAFILRSSHRFPSLEEIDEFYFDGELSAVDLPRSPLRL